MSREQCAQAALGLIRPGMTVGMGGGSTVALLIGLAAGTDITVVSPSWDTLRLCREQGLKTASLQDTESVDIAFDGCDELDMQLNALKSCGGIHTREKITAAMAEDYVLLADSSKLADSLSFDVPVVLEVLEPALASVRHKLEKAGYTAQLRCGSGKTGPVVTDDGHLLMDLTVPADADVQSVYRDLQDLPGVVENSLFYQVATKAVISGENGIEIIERNR